jgi:hypothetical protein
MVQHKYPSKGQWKELADAALILLNGDFQLLLEKETTYIP